MNKKDTQLWIGLVLLTLASYFSAESSIGKPFLVFLILGISAVKFLGVGFQFMELKKAHNFWKVSFVSMLLLFTALVIFLY